ncbi:SGNH/GDSL hydrolase family protein [Aeromicrobium halocynthiae]|uniref:SGNH/GDSL hydrolase family protein n=1 Tax=Aeromicrobium halocynthiae TaxID=560557 RepID=A0ABN2VSZ1_9ACTN
MVTRGVGWAGLTVLTAVVLAVSLTFVGGAADGAHAVDRPFERGIVVVGDSITARYSDRAGTPDEAWWSIVGRRLGTDVRTYAQSGSGYLRRGLRCTGDTFPDRTAAFEDPPAVFVIAGGRNDWARCERGQHVRAGDAEIAAAVTTYLRLVQQRLPASTRIVVLEPPWGDRDPWEQRRLTSIVRTAAGREGVEFVATAGTLTGADRTTDGVHPTRAGSVALGERVAAALR